MKIKFIQAVHCIVLLFSFSTIRAQNITTFAGGGGVNPGDGGQATAAMVSSPFDMCIDAAGNKYIVSLNAGRIRKVAPDGIISTIIGNGTAAVAADGTVATAATVNMPRSIAIDAAGNIYFAEDGSKIRKIDAVTKVLSTVAGGGAATTNGIQATAASIEPYSIRLDASGNLYFADKATNRLRKITMATGVVTTIAGTGNAGHDGEGLAATASRLNWPSGIAFDGTGNMYISQRGNARVSVVKTDGKLYTVAGTGTMGYDGDGIATAKQLHNPGNIAIDRDGNLLIPEWDNHRVRKVNMTTGMMTTIAGNGTASETGNGGPATAATVNSPTSVVVDGSGDIYICNTNGARVRKITCAPVIGMGSSTICAGSSTTLTASGTVEYTWAPAAALSASTGASVIASPTVATTYTVTGSGSVCNGTATATVAVDNISFTSSADVTISAGASTSLTASGATTYTWLPATGLSATTGTSVTATPSISTVYTVTGVNGACTRAAAVAVIIPEASRTITAFAGGGSTVGDGGPATTALIMNPRGVTVDAAGNVYIAGANRVRKVTSAGIISTIAGNTGSGSSGDGGPATAAVIGVPYSVAFDAAGNIYITDNENNFIRKVNSAGIISTMAGMDGGDTLSDNIQATAAVISPRYLVCDKTANQLYVSCGLTNRVRKIDLSTGIITTVAGNGVEGTSIEGAIATATPMNRPSGIVFDASGNLYISQTDAGKVSVLKADGRLYTVAGTGTTTFNGDGVATAKNINPWGIAIDSDENLLVADGLNHRLRKINLTTGIMTTLAGNGTASETGDGGAATAATLHMPNGVTTDAEGGIYIADRLGGRVRKIICVTPTLNVTGGGAIELGLASALGVIGASSYKWSPAAGLSATTGAGVTASPTVTTTYTVTGSTGGCINTATVTVSVNQAVSKYIWPFAGGGFTFVEGGPATAAPVGGPNDICIDATGNKYIAQGSSHRITKVTPAGIITTIAGTGVSATSADGAVAATSAISQPSCIAMDAAGNIYFGEEVSKKVRKIDAATGLLSTVAGNGSSSSGATADGVQATASRMVSRCIRFDAAGDLYLVDGLARVRKVNMATGIITTVAGIFELSGYSGEGFAATASQLSTPRGIAFDAGGNMYISQIGRVSVVKPDGKLYTVAGTGVAGYDGDGIATAKQLNDPYLITIDGDGNLLLPDRTDSRIRKVFLSTGIMTTIAGTGTATESGNAGPATAATLQTPNSVAVDVDGNIFICNTNGHRVRVIGTCTTPVVSASGTTTMQEGTSTTLTVTGTASAYTWSPPNGLSATTGSSVTATVYGNITYRVTGNTGYCASTSTVTVTTTSAPSKKVWAFAGGGSALGDDGQASAAQILTPTDMCIDVAGNKYIALGGNHRIRKITPAGIITTIAGNGTGANAADGVSATTATINNAVSVAVDAAGNIYFAEQDNNRVRKIDAVTGVLSTIAGNGSASGATANNIQATAASMTPVCVRADAPGDLYITDLSTHRVRKVNMTTGIITTIAGTGTAGYDGEGVTATSSRLNTPKGIAFDAAGNVYISQTEDDRIRVVKADGKMYTAGGTGTAAVSYNGNGIATSTNLNDPGYIAVDGDGNLLIPQNAGRVRKIYVSLGMTTTIAGTGSSSETGNGGAATAAGFNVPSSVAIDADGNIFICSNTGGRVRVIGNCTVPTINISGGGTICLNTTATLSATGATNYTWSPSASLSVSTGAGVIASPTVTTTYTVTGSTGYCTSTATVTVSVNPLPTAITGTATVCVNNATTLNSTPSGGTWGSSNSNASVSSTGVVTGNMGGATVITYTRTNGCYITKEVTVNALPVVAITGASVVCNGAGVALSATGGLANYSWVPATGLSCTTCLSVTATPAVATTYTLTATDANGCSNTATKAITVATVSVTASPDVSIYLGESSVLTGSGAITYTWLPVDGLSATTGTAVTASPTVSTTYTVTGSTNTCANTAIVTVSVNSTPSKNILAFAGYGSSLADGVQAITAVIFSPGDMCIDAAGNKYIVQGIGHRIRKITSAGVITTIAGTGTAGTAANGAAAATATVNDPGSIAVDAAGNVYFAERGSNRVRKINAATGLLSTVAGNGSTSATANNIQATAASVTPSCIRFDAAGNLFIVDGNRVRKVNMGTGIITTVAGSVSSGTSVEGVAATANQLNGPRAVAFDAAGNIYISQIGAGKVSVVKADGKLYTVAGTGVNGYSGEGIATAQQLNQPFFISVGADGNLLIPDRANHRVRKLFLSTGIITTIAGTGTAGETGNDGPATSANLNTPNSVVEDADGNIFICDENGSKVRVISDCTAPTVSASGGGAICSGSTAALTAAGNATSYFWSPSESLSASTGTGVVASPTTTTTYTVTGNAGYCLSTATVAVSVNPLPTAITGTATVCVNATTTLNSTPTGGTWSSSAMAIASVSTARVVTGNAAGTATITYTRSNGCYRTREVTVNSLPAMSITGPSAVCSGSGAAIVATGGFTSYVWAPAAGMACSTCSSVSVVPTVATTYTVTTTNVNGCSNTATKTITVDNISLSVSPGVYICAGSQETLTASGATSYTWLPVTGLSATTGASVTASPTVTTTYTVTGTSGVCTSIATVTVTVNEIPSVGVSGAATICSGASTPLSATGGVSYTWTPGAGLSCTTCSSVSATPATTTTYTVVGTGANSCTNTATVSVSVNALPSAITGTATVCVNATTTLNGTPAGGTWSSSNSNASVSSAGVVTGNIAGTATITYTRTNGCYRTAGVTVNEIPSVGASGAATICSGASTPLSATGGVSYMWVPATGLSCTTCSSVSATPTTTTTYTVTGASANSCTNTATVSVSVNALPSDITGVAIMCVNATTTLNSTPASGTWASSNSNASVSSGGVVTGNTAGTATITYVQVNGCFKVTEVTVNANPTVSITGPSDVCSGSSAALSGTGGLITYSWAPVAGLSCTTCSSVSATPSVATTYTLTATNMNGCSNMATKAVTVITVPVTVSPGATICTGSSETLTASGATSYSWLPSTGLSATTGSSVTASPSVATTYTVTGSDGVCTNTATVTISVNPMPAAITGTAQVCRNATITLNCTPTGGTWSNNNTNTSVVFSGAVTGNVVGTSVITYSLAGGCYTTTTVTITDLPTVSAGSGTTICPGASAALNASGAVSYTWVPAAGLSATTGITVTASPTVATTYTLTGTDANGCTNTATNAVGITPLQLNVSPNKTICTGTSDTLNATGAANYTWSPSGSLSATTGATVTITPPGATTYTVTGTTGACSQTKTVTVDVGSLANITGASTICKSANSLFIGTPAGGVWSHSANGVAFVGSTTGSVYGANAGTAIITYLAAGCTAVKEVTVLGTPAITGLSSVCIGHTMTMANTSSGGTWSSSNDAIASIESSSGLLTGLDAGIVTITYTAVTGCFVTKQVTIGTPPPIDGSVWVCLNSTVELHHPIAGGVWSSSNPARASVDAATGVVHGITLGNFFVSYTLGSGCVRTMEMAVQTFPLGITGSLNVCEGLITNLSNETVSGTWSSSDEAVAHVSLLTGSVYGLTAGTTNITYKFHSCINSKVVTVHPLPATIMGDNELCGGASVPYSSTPTGGTWSSSNTSRATVGLSSGIAMGGSSSGAVTLTYTSPGGCVTTKGIIVNPQPGVLSGATTVCAGNTTTITSALEGGTWSSSDGSVASVGTALGWSTTVSGLLPGTTTVTATTEFGCTRSTTVTVTAAAGTIGGDNVVCPGGTIQLINTATGGTWSSSATAKATVNTTTGLVSGVAAGTANISYKTSSTCYAVQQITVNGTPAGITGPSTVCVGSTVTLAHAETGGTWTSSNTSRATINATSGEVMGISAGALTITYQINSGCSRTFAMMVNAVPATIGGAGTLCQGSTATLTNSTAGGTWSSSNTSVVMVPSTPGNVTGVGAGMATITYKITSTNCYVTKDITVNEQPTAIAGGPNKLCVGAIETYASTPTGGTWTSSMPARASVDASTGQLTGLSAGTMTLSYTLSTGCYRVLAMTVNALPAAIGGIAAVCQNATTALTNGTTGGTWSSSAIGTASVTATGVVTGVSAGMANITYKVTGTGCQVMRQVTVNELPSAIGGANQICIGNTESYSSTPTGGTWISSAATATINSASGVATGISMGVTTLTYTAPVTGCRITKQVTINAVPNAITGLSTVCVGNSVTLSNTTLSQTWSSTTGAATIVAISSGAATLTGVSAGTTIISYTNAAGCARTLAITVNDAVPAITGDMIVCPTRTILLSTTAAGGTWSSALTTKATVNTTGLVTGVSAGMVNISYIVSPGCNAVANVTVSPAPAGITGLTSVCPMDMIDLNHATTGGTWSASNGNVSVDTDNGEVTGVTSGTSVVSYRINSGCFVTSTVTIKAQPAAIGGGLTVVMGATSALTNATTGGTWSSSNTDAATIISTSGLMSGVDAGTTIITYRVTTTQCYRTAEATVIRPAAGRQAGVANTGTTRSILIYPNPTTGVLTIEALSEGMFTLYTLDGKEVRKYRTEAPITSVSIPNNLAAGVYMCRFEGADGSTKIVRIVYNP